MTHSLFKIALFATLGLGTALSAQDYQLTIGDRLSLDYNFVDRPKEMVVDLDGNIRLPELGSLRANGQSLDQVEELIESRMLQNGFSGIPTVSLEIQEYAPVVVTGLAEKGGQFQFFPGMTVGVALAMAGGSNGLQTTTGPQAEIASMAAQRRSVDFASQIAATAVQITRLEADRDNTALPLVMSDALRQSIPGADDAVIANHLRGESEILENDRATAEELLANWDKALSDSANQIALLDDRIDLKQELIDQLEVELDKANALKQQGLSTNTRTINAVQRLADEREDFLALQTTKLTIARAVSQTQITRTNFISNRKRDVLEALQAARIRMDFLQQSYRLTLSEIAILYGGIENLSAVTGGPGLSFALSGPRADRIAEGEITEATPLFPGDILVVKTDIGS